MRRVLWRAASATSPLLPLLPAQTLESDTARVGGTLFRKGLAAGRRHRL